MEDFNFSSLTPVQQDAPPSMLSVINSTSSPFPLSSQAQGCDLNSHLFNVVGGAEKEYEDTTMYITVDTGPPSTNVIQLLNNSPPPPSNISNLCTSSFTPDHSIPPKNGNTAFASLMIDTDASGNTLTNYFPSKVSPLHKPSTIYIDNISSIATHSSNTMPSISGIHPTKLDGESNPGTSNVLTSFPSSELPGSSLFCGECSVNLTSSGSFFEHWVTHHCQLLQPSNSINIESTLQHQQTNFNDAAAISSDEMKNLVISGNSIVDNSSEPTKELSSETSSTGLVMERCSVCNHIFVQGTDRHKQHSRAGPCVLNSNNMNMMENRHNVDIVNNNNQVSNFQTMIPFNGDNLKLDIVQESVLEKSDASSNASLLSTVSQNISHSTGNKKRKFGVISPTSSDASVRNVTKKHEATGISNHNKNCVCGVCNAQVKTITSYFLHWLEQHQDDSSLKNQTTVNNPAECASSANILQEVWQCRACPTNITKLFPNSGMLTSHVEAEHERTNGAERSVNDKLITSSCQIIFQNKESFDKHVELFHQVNHSTNDNSPNSGNKSKCPFCDKFLGDQANDNTSFLCDHYRKEHLVSCKGKTCKLFTFTIIPEFWIKMTCYFLSI